VRAKSRWLVVAVFALAMAWVESAVVHYLRTYLERIQPYQANPLPTAFNFGEIEVVREAATLVMLALVGWLAGKNLRSSCGYALIAFGVWDIAYYGFLHLMNGWPQSLFDWDLLFLIPLPWWGPVWAPMLISVLMIALGSILTVLPRHAVLSHPGRSAWIVAATGAALALYTFMADAIQLLPTDEAAMRSLLPVTFQWPLFLIAVGLMSAPVWSSIIGTKLNLKERVSQLS
jgi:hypothetical protein